jgi:stearoyl-CoA desaturase (delta-9 desaturase)
MSGLFDLHLLGLPWLDLPWWGNALAALAMTHITIASVTIFLHRHQSHRALTLHPAVSHFFRFWLWLTTGIVTREWVAIHRKHHVTCETAEDPHSPQIHGIRNILLEGSEFYRKEAKNQETLQVYGKGTPDDWLERHVYTRHPGLGIALMFALDLTLFGAIGITVWAVQMIWIPFFAAGVINGVGHFWGYRNFVTEDASRNIFPWGILIGGEELHNNHHAFSASARLSSRWWEFDIGWAYIRTLAALKLARVLKVAPRMRRVPFKPQCDLATLQALIVHRYEVQARFAHILKRTAIREFKQLRKSHPLPDFKHAWANSTVKQWLQKGTGNLPEPQLSALSQALHASSILRTIDTMRQELLEFGAKSTASREQLVQQLEDWCRRAEASGIQALQQFSRQLRCYA